jgi:hypothetical protein
MKAWTRYTWLRTEDRQLVNTVTELPISIILDELLD